MTVNKTSSTLLDLTADVLIIGGGLAGTWAAIAAAREGSQVILVDKGFCGTSGVTATAGPGHWWVPPQPEVRQAAIDKRLATAYGLADPNWMARALDTTWTTLPGLAGYYDFPQDEAGVTQYRGLRGPEYLRGLRRLVEDSGVTILDHSPALELLRDEHGAIAGARGWRRQAGGDWLVAAASVVVATGGCAFLSRLLGSHTNTGDGYLMAVEAGAELSGSLGPVVRAMGWPRRRSPGARTTHRVGSTAGIPGHRSESPEQRTFNGEPDVDPAHSGRSSSSGQEPVSLGRATRALVAGARLGVGSGL